MKKALHHLMFLIMLLCGQTAMAEDYTFQEGENTILENVSVNGTYTVKQTGKVVIETMQQNFTITCAGVTAEPKTVYIDSYNTRYDVQAKAGDVISITASFCLGNKLRITELGEGQINILPVATTPAANTTFVWNTSGMVTVQFNTPVTATNATVTCGGKSYSVDNFRVNAQFVSFNITSAINAAYEAGTATEGKNMTIRITGIADLYDSTNKYAGTGNYIFAYKTPHQQGTLLSATVNGQELQQGVNNYTFLSFYAPDNQDGIFTFEFSKPVKSIEHATLNMGNLDQATAGKYYYEEIEDVTIDGNKVIVDVRGMLRSYARMFPSVDISQETTNPDERGYVNYNNINLAITNVIDENDNTMYSSAQGSVGSFSYTFNYEEIVDNIAMDGDNIQEGEAVKCGQEIRLWVDQKVKSINGIKVSYKIPQGALDEETAAKGMQRAEEIEGDDLPDYETVTVNLDMSNVRIEDDPTGCVVVFNIPSEMKYAVEAEQVRVVVGVTTTNGMPHDLVINFFYESVPTAINAITTANPDAASAAYNLAGQRVNSDAKGIIITNGKKIIKK